MVYVVRKLYLIPNLNWSYFISRYCRFRRSSLRSVCEHQRRLTTDSEDRNSIQRTPEFFIVTRENVDRVPLQTSIIRRNDHSTIGGVLGAVLVPAILWKRAGIINRMLCNCSSDALLMSLSLQLFSVVLALAALLVY